MAQKAPYNRGDAVARLAAAVEDVLTDLDGDPAMDLATPMLREALLTVLAAVILTPADADAKPRAESDAARLLAIVTAASGLPAATSLPRRPSPKAARIQ